MKLLVGEVLVSLFKDYLVPIALGVGLASAIALGIQHFKPKEVVVLPLKEPLSIVCMQDAPVRYDWNNNLIVEGMKE